MKKLTAYAFVGMLAFSTPTTAQSAQHPEFQVAQATVIYSCTNYSPRQFFLVTAAGSGGFSSCTAIGFSWAEAFGRVCYYLSAGTSTTANWPQYLNPSAPLGVTIPAC